MAATAFVLYREEKKGWGRWRGRHWGRRRTWDFQVQKLILHEKTQEAWGLLVGIPHPLSSLQKIRIKAVGLRDTLKKNLPSVSLCTRVKTSFLHPSRECWREDEPWGAQPEPLSSVCSRFHGPRRWFAFLGQQPAICKQETSRQASLLHTKWHERLCGPQLRLWCAAAKPLRLPATPVPSFPLTHAPNCPKPELCLCMCPTWDAWLLLETGLFHLACCLAYEFPGRPRKELYLPTNKVQIHPFSSFPICSPRLSLQCTISWSRHGDLHHTGRTDSWEYRPHAIQSNLNLLIHLPNCNSLSLLA